LLQVRYLQGQNARMQEKLTQAERSACATLAQKVCPILGMDQPLILGDKSEQITLHFLQPH